MGVGCNPQFSMRQRLLWTLFSRIKEHLPNICSNTPWRQLSEAYWNSIWNYPYLPDEVDVITFHGITDPVHRTEIWSFEKVRTLLPPQGPLDWDWDQGLMDFLNLDIIYSLYSPWYYLIWSFKSGAFTILIIHDHATTKRWEGDIQRASLFERCYSLTVLNWKVID